MKTLEKIELFSTEYDLSKDVYWISRLFITNSPIYSSGRFPIKPLFTVSNITSVDSFVEPLEKICKEPLKYLKDPVLSFIAIKALKYLDFKIVFVDHRIEITKHGSSTIRRSYVDYLKKELRNL